MTKCISVRIVLLLLPQLSIALAGVPRIVKQPRDFVRNEKEPVTMECVAEGDPKPKLTWHRAETGAAVLTSKQAPTSASVHVSDIGTLYFLSVEPRNEGAYYCNATNRFGSAKSRNATLRIAYLDSEFEYGPQSKVAAMQSTVELICRPPRGLPKPAVHWNKNGRRIHTSSRVKVTRQGDLRIDRTIEDDGGRYTCVAVNMAGQRESEPATLTIRSKPKFDTTPTDESVRVNQNVSFKCRASGDPPPSVTWKREEGTVPDSRTKILSDGSLQIINVQLADAGKYICVAKSPAGTIEAVAKLDVLSKPQFVVTPKDKSVKEGDTVTFNCKVSGQPKPTVYWNYNTMKFLFIDQVDDTGRGKVMKDGRLIIRNVQKADEGMYECHGSNYIAFIATSARLKVQKLSSSVPPVIEFGPQNQTLRVGANAALRCVVRLQILRIPYDIEWYKNGVKLTSSKRGGRRQPPRKRIQQVADGGLHIYSLEMTDKGNYTCLVTAGGKSTAWSAILNVLRHGDPGPLGGGVDIAVLPQPPEAVKGS